MGESQDRAAIEKRAHQLWEEEGRPEGRAVEHWQRAEHELSSQSHTSAPEPVPPAPDVGDPPQRPPAPDVGDPPNPRQPPPGPDVVDPPQTPDGGETHDPTPPTRSVAGGPDAVKAEAAAAGAAAATAGIDAGASAQRKRKPRKPRGD